MRSQAATLLISCLACMAATSCVQPAANDAAAPAAAKSPAEQFIASVHRTVLPNGLTVLTREQKGSGIVAINTWVKAGYFHEPDEVAGMAHLFEHMFFKGSQAYPQPEAIAQAVSSAGGSMNAGTIYDSTNYYVVVPKENFAKGVEIQADAIAHPLFDPRQLKKEAEVVIEESNRKFDNPPAVAFERMLATSYTRHRVKRWRIGSNEVLRNIRRDNLMAFFESLYRPENIIVTVAGDVSPDEALAAVRRSFGGLARGQLRKGRGPVEPPQGEFRFGRSEADIKEGYSVFGWHTVPENHGDEVTLEVLAGILGGGRSSRFYRAAVGPAGASSVSASHFTFEDVGVFSITASLAEANRGEVERRIVSEIQRMKQFGPTAYELAQAKNVREAAFLGEIESSLEQAQTLSQLESRGSYRDLARRVAQIEALTAEQVRDAARRYLATDQLTLYHYQPKGAPALTSDSALERLRGAEATPVTASDVLPLPDVRNSVRSAAADAPLQTFQLSNGATLVVQQRTGAPTVTTGIYFRGGRTQETPATAGITHLMQATMRRGTATRSGEALDREIEFLGTQLGITTQDDGFGFTFTTMGRFYEPALRIAADVLLNPSFTQDGLAREKSLQIAAIRRSLDSSSERPMQLFRAAMFGDHPYGLPELGTEATIASIDRSALQRWWKASVAGDRALIVVVGNAAAEDVRRVMEEKLAELPRSAGALASLPPPSLPTSVRENTEQRDRKQTAMVIGFPAVPASNPEWPALRLMQSLTSGLSGTFFAELRGRQSLAYSVFAGPVTYAKEGAFRGYLAGEASKEETARRALLAEMRKLQDEGVTDADVARAKSFFAGSTRLARETNGALASDYGRNYVLALPLDYTDRVLRIVPTLTAEDLRKAARNHLGGDNYVYAAVRGRPTP
ncbi:MAG: M16 family metallopeptidase [Usitatibacter sp.]